MSIDTRGKLKTLGELARFDTTGLPQLFNPGDYLKHSHFIYPAVGFKGRCANLFKVLQTNFCQYNCFYCVNRQQRNCERLTFKPEELASVFLNFYRRRWVEGLFLTSAIYPNPNLSQERMFITLRLIRQAGFRGYIHTVILPGVDAALIQKIGQLSDRLSLNLEAPNQEYLSILSPSKDFKKDLFNGLKNLSFFHKRHPLKAGLTTQLVVGAANESDKEILSLSQELYKNLSLERIYYSGFSPVEDTPFENKPACSTLREARIYQADFLLRHYGFNVEELTFDKKGDLYEDLDPKLAWAKAHPEKFPIEINSAGLEQLLRVPGIGRISATRIVTIRKGGRILRLEDLRKLGAIVSRARNFITLAGKSYILKENLRTPLSKEKQLFLWEEL